LWIFLITFQIFLFNGFKLKNKGLNMKKLKKNFGMELAYYYIQYLKSRKT